jgi:hypothetical protein
MIFKSKRALAANIILGLLGVLLVGIEIGKQSQAGNLSGAYILVIAAISTLASGNINEIFNIISLIKSSYVKSAEPPKTNEPE